MCVCAQVVLSLIPNLFPLACHASLNSKTTQTRAHHFTFPPGGGDGPVRYVINLFGSAEVHRSTEHVRGAPLFWRTCSAQQLAVKRHSNVERLIRVGEV